MNLFYMLELSITHTCRDTPTGKEMEAYIVEVCNCKGQETLLLLCSDAPNSPGMYRS